jgi:lysophospholipid acyltransferase (LPLAT)-like uncharacterized protein
MKIRNPRLVKIAGYVLARSGRLLIRTMTGGYTPLGPNVNASEYAGPDRFLYSIWHENLLLPAVAFGHSSVAVLASKHADGQLIATVARYMGMRVVVGSSNRGGTEALRQLVDPDAPWRHLAVTPDGPRGPRRLVKPGIIYVAAKTGMKIVPSGIACPRSWRLKSWDRFVIPKPFSHAIGVSAEPISVPPTVGANDLEPYRLQVQNEMDRLQAIVDHWAETGEIGKVKAVTKRAA